MNKSDAMDNVKNIQNIEELAFGQMMLSWKGGDPLTPVMLLEYKEKFIPGVLEYSGDGSQLFTMIPNLDATFETRAAALQVVGHCWDLAQADLDKRIAEDEAFRRDKEVKQK